MESFNKTLISETTALQIVSVIAWLWVVPVIDSLDSYSYGRDVYSDICKQHAENSCSSFEYTDTGFKAEFSNKGTENLLFFSVPYSDGFTAFVNGKETEIEKVNNGFMAVLVPAESECDIEFVYKTPGLSTGIIITAVSFGLLLVYASIVILLSYKKKDNLVSNQENEI